jgi:peptidoglycan/LPS O-acetylase OafA/YrhL
VFSGLLIDKFDSGPLSMDGMTFGPSAYLPRLFLHTILCSAISVAIAFVSYNLFEKPFLKLKRFFA